MRLRALASDIGCLLRRDGVRQTASRLADGYRPDELLVIVKRLDDIQQISFQPRLQVAELTGGWLPALAELNRRRCDTRASARFAADLERGHRGFVASVDGVVVGYYWWANGRHPHLDRLGIALEAGDVYGFDFYLAEEHRGDGNAVAFLHAVETALREQGFARLWGYVRDDNRPARWLYSLRGYEVIKHLHLRPRQLR
jgi:GNAT superfamily N-acetyltransferase